MKNKQKKAHLTMQPFKQYYKYTTKNMLQYTHNQVSVHFFIMTANTKHSPFWWHKQFKKCETSKRFPSWEQMLTSHILTCMDGGRDPRPLQMFNLTWQTLGGSRGTPILFINCYCSHQLHTEFLTHPVDFKQSFIVTSEWTMKR